MTKQIKTIIVDLEGTLSDNSHRHDLRGDYEAYDAALENDEPVTWLINLIEVLSEVFDICVISNSTNREAVFAWLSDNGVSADDILLRPKGNFDSEIELKLSLCSSIDNVSFIIDDNERVCDALRNEGLNVVMV